MLIKFTILIATKIILKNAKFESFVAMYKVNGKKINGEVLLANS